MIGYILKPTQKMAQVMVIGFVVWLVLEGPSMYATYRANMTDPDAQVEVIKSEDKAAAFWRLSRTVTVTVTVTSVRQAAAQLEEGHRRGSRTYFHNILTNETSWER